jgi:hypothetical protein
MKYLSLNGIVRVPVEGQEVVPFSERLMGGL